MTKFFELEVFQHSNISWYT